MKISVELPDDLAEAFLAIAGDVARMRRELGDIRAMLSQGMWNVAARVDRIEARIADPPEAKTPAASRASWRTPERAQVLRRDWPAGVHVSDIRAQLQALPGPPVRDNLNIATWASELGVRRPPGKWSMRDAPLVAQASGDRPPTVQATGPSPSVAKVIRDPLSVARMLDADAARQHAATPITMADALDWAWNNKLRPLAGETQRQTFGRINRMRKSLGLPAFTLIAPRGPHVPLPPPDVGGAERSAA